MVITIHVSIYEIWNNALHCRRHSPEVLTDYRFVFICIPPSETLRLHTGEQEMCRL